MTDEYSSNIGNDTPIGQTVMQRNKVTKHLIVRTVKTMLFLVQMIV